jgi:hypothetical protein
MVWRLLYHRASFEPTLDVYFRTPKETVLFIFFIYISHVIPVSNALLQDLGTMQV